VRFAQPALAAMPAIDVHFRAHKIARLDGAHLVAHALDRAAKFVPSVTGGLMRPCDQRSHP